VAKLRRKKPLRGLRFKHISERRGNGSSKKVAVGRGEGVGNALGGCGRGGRF